MIERNLILFVRPIVLLPSLEFNPRRNFAAQCHRPHFQMSESTPRSGRSGRNNRNGRNRRYSDNRNEPRRNHQERRRDGWFSTKKDIQIDPFAGDQVVDLAPGKLPPSTAAILCFRNDLRIQDNPALNLAATADVIVPLFVFDDYRYGMDRLSPHGFPRSGIRRASFVIQAVQDLAEVFDNLGVPLVVRHGSAPDAVVEAVMAAAKVDNVRNIALVAHRESGWEEARDEKRISRAAREAAEKCNKTFEHHALWSTTLHHPLDLPLNPAGPALPPTFTAYRKIAEANGGTKILPLYSPPESLVGLPAEQQLPKQPVPSLETLGYSRDLPADDSRAVMLFHGGERTGLARIREYVWDKRCIAEYKQTRNKSGVRDASSKFSPWLALGCITPKQIYWQVSEFEEKYGATEDTYWMTFELMTRDYFHWLSMCVGSSLYALNGFSGRGDKASGPVWKSPPITTTQKQQLDAWIAGRTGAPFVDSSMRELAATGFMSNRGRQNVASFLVHDLQIPDWRIGAEYFESVLIDHEVAANWGNWAYLAGVGSDPRAGRKFNVVKQGLDYEPDGEYIRKWCPELESLPVRFVHQPHNLTAEEKEKFSTLAKVYPKPIVSLPSPPSASSHKSKGRVRKRH